MKKAYASLGSLLVVSLVCTGPTLGQADDAKPAKPVTVPFEMLKSGHMAVNVKVDGKGPYRLIFDTGSPLTLITSKVAKEADLAPAKASSPLFGMLGGGKAVNVKRWQLGDISAENLPVLVMDHPLVRVLAQEVGPLEGIVGFPFFARYALTVDYQKKELTLVPNGYEPTDVLESMMKTILALQDRNPPKQIVSSSAQWGLVLGKDEKDTSAGVTIRSVYTNSAAARAGLQAGDRLLTLAGRWTDTVLDAHAAANLAKPGTEIVLRIVRGGKEMEVKVVPRAGF